MEPSARNIQEGIKILDNYAIYLRDNHDLERSTILGIEGSAAKVYFQRLFFELSWERRRPRVKADYVNCLLDIGYTVLFNFIDSLLRVYDFDSYKGVLHTCFYQRKSLVCDLMEPFRPLIDWRVRKAIRLNQFRKEDFVIIKDQYQLDYKKTSDYVFVFMEDVLKAKEEIFIYMRAYYRAFMKGKNADEFPIYSMNDSKVIMEVMEEEL